MFDSGNEPDAGSRLAEINRCQTAREERLARREAEMTTLQAEINAAQAKQVEFVADYVVRDDAWANYAGLKSAAGFLTWKLGYTPGAARAVIKAAEGLESFPTLKESFSAGELSLSQVTVLLDICEDDTEERLVELAKGLSGAQLSRFAGHYRSALRLQEDRAHEQRFLTTGHRGDGSWVITGRLSSEQGAIIEQALRMALDASADVGAELDDHADDPWGARRADALTAVAESVLATGIGRRQPSDRYLVNVHAELDTLYSQEGVARLRDGGVISARSAALLSCNASIVEIITKGGQPLDVGRKRRNPTVAIRRALEERDRCCDMPGCTRTVDLHAHHDDAWGGGGHTKVRKMKLWCGHDHRGYHAGDFTVEGTWPDLIYRARNGKIIERPALRASGDGLGPLNRSHGVEVDERTCLPDWGGERGGIRYVADDALSRRKGPQPLPPKGTATVDEEGPSP